MVETKNDNNWFVNWEMGVPQWSKNGVPGMLRRVKGVLQAGYAGVLAFVWPASTPDPAGAEGPPEL